MPLPPLQPIRRLAAIGLAALCGCRPAPAIKVAFIGGLSGHASDLAIGGRNGAQLAIETLNAQPGPRYELHVHDDGRPPEAATAAVDAVGVEGLHRKSARQSLRDVLRAPGEWPGLQQPVALDRFGDSIRRFHLSEVRKGRFVMQGT